MDEPEVDDGIIALTGDPANCDGRRARFDTRSALIGEAAEATAARLFIASNDFFFELLDDMLDINRKLFRYITNLIYYRNHSRAIVKENRICSAS